MKPTTFALEGLLMLFLGLFSSCDGASSLRFITGPRGPAGSDGATIQGPTGGSCHVVDTDGGVEITCDDGSSAFIADGEVVIVTATPTPAPCKHPDPQLEHGNDSPCHD